MDEGGRRQGKTEGSGTSDVYISFPIIKTSLLIYTLLGFRLYLICHNNHLFFLIELKNWNRFSIDYHSTWGGILP